MIGTAQAPGLVIRPPAAAWGAALRRRLNERSRRFRVQMNLPTDRPLVMTGHQAEFWHPGILAKYLAADAAAAALDAEVAWLVVDQDRPERVEVRYPVEDEGRLRVRTAVLAGTGRNGAPRNGGMLASVRTGLTSMREALARHEGAGSIARTVAAALDDLLTPLLARPHPATIFATDLHRTDLFAELVERMGREPERCIAAYNAAVARHPSAGMRPLIADEVQDRWELPLWRLEPGGPRRHVYAEDLPSIPREELAPKALFMTGLIRLAGCDLFIHGTGGGGAAEDGEGYDRVTEEWLCDWLRIGPGDLAPITVVTATLHLPLRPGPPPSQDQVARTVWLAHHARHNPDVLRDAYTADAKAKLIAAMRGAPRDERRLLFLRMHEVLEQYRVNHTADLRALEQNAADACGRLEDAAVAMDRTWPFPLYPPDMLASLRRELEAAFGVGH